MFSVLEVGELNCGASGVGEAIRGIVVLIWLAVTLADGIRLAEGKNSMLVVAVGRNVPGDDFVSAGEEVEITVCAHI